jgi:hypothetical protein
MTDNPTHTHTAYAFSRQSKKMGRLLECGTARIDKERNIVHVFMNRTPITGYTGYIVVAPAGMPPPQALPPAPETGDENQDADEE